MHKSLVPAATTLAVAVFLSGALFAQQTSSTSSSGSKPATSGAKTSSGTQSKTGTTAKSSEPMTLTTDKEKLSYALGMSIGMGMKHDNLDVDPKVLAQGLNDVMSGAKPMMTDAEAQAVLSKFRSDMMAKREAEAQRVSAGNKQEGEKFLAENKTKPGVVTLPSGLQYKVIQEGTGPKPTANDTVVCKYRGTLINGTEFDNSEKHGGTATFPVNGVIKGWTEALQLMPVGSKWQLFVPADLAYGDRGAGQDIGPNSTLIFDVDLVSIKDKQAPEVTQPQSKQ